MNPYKKDLVDFVKKYKLSKYKDNSGTSLLKYLINQGRSRDLLLLIGFNSVNLRPNTIKALGLALMMNI